MEKTPAPPAARPHWPMYALLALYAGCAAATILFFDGTGDEGDSVHHYLFARYAPLHPELFMDHWAKPLYVLLACPFAQFGFVGAKIFNVLSMMGAMWFTYLTAQALRLNHAAAAGVLMMFAPLCYVLTFSGLTEPLFALFIALSVYCAATGRYLAAALLVSFLPFVRSEGLVIMGVFGAYFLLKKEWRMVPLLMAGHVVYSVAGYFAHHDIWWVFKKIPYATLSSVYGSGELSHFVVELFYVLGAPIYALFCLGLLRWVWDIFQSVAHLRGVPHLPHLGGVPHLPHRDERLLFQSVAHLGGVPHFHRDERLLVLLGFGAFFVFHTMAWHWGMFNSFGLNRVLLGVLPLIALIALEGLNLLASLAGKNILLGRAALGVLVGLVVIFPFTPSPSALHWQRDLNLTFGQHVALRSAAFVRDSLGAGHRIVSGHPYVSEAYGVDHFDPRQRINLTPEYLERAAPGDVVVWDYWMGFRENRVTKESLDARPNLKKVFEHEEMVSGRPVFYALYLVRER